MEGNSMRRVRTAPVQFCTVFAAALPVAAGAQFKQSPAQPITGNGSRILHWFGHYLWNEPAPAWITSSVSVLECEQERKRASKKGS